MIELVLVYGEVEQVLAPVGNPLPWTLGPELGQLPFQGCSKACCPKSTCGSTVISPPSLAFAADPTKIPRPPFYQEVSLDRSSSRTRPFSADQPPDPRETGSLRERVGREASIKCIFAELLVPFLGLVLLAPGVVEVDQAIGCVAEARVGVVVERRNFLPPFG